VLSVPCFVLHADADVASAEVWRPFPLQRPSATHV
jgi:hypothetical protein